MRSKVRGMNGKTYSQTIHKLASLLVAIMLITVVGIIFFEVRPRQPVARLSTQDFWLIWFASMAGALSAKLMDYFSPGKPSSKESLGVQMSKTILLVIMWALGVFVAMELLFVIGLIFGIFAV